MLIHRKTDYGFDLSDALAERAVSELSYEIDTEVVKLLSDNAPENATLTWSRTQPVGVSMREHFDSFLNTLAKAKQVVYDATQKFVPNWLLVASDIVPVLSMISAFKAAPTGQVNGPYFAGTIDSFKVFVSPALESGRFIAGVLGSDMYSAAAVYAPYMPVVPTQLLGFADGGMSQGWSTLYDLKMLNPSLLAKGQVVA